ncbi:MAG: MXAN_5187 C-terminal domain-containing protein [Acidobacteriota bacterium]
MRKPSRTNDRSRETGPRSGAQLDALAREVEQFRIDAARFLAGDLHLPPEELRERIAASFRRLRGEQKLSVAENFRVNSLEARFNSQLDLYKRRLREREEGGARRVVAEPAAPDPHEGVVYGRRGDPNAVEVLYKGLYLRNGAGNPSMDLERFRSYLQRQTDAIRSKTGCEDIHFRVSVEDGKTKLKARPVKR